MRPERARTARAPRLRGFGVSGPTASEAACSRHKGDTMDDNALPHFASSYLRGNKQEHHGHVLNHSSRAPAALRRVPSISLSGWRRRCTTSPCSPRTRVSGPSSALPELSGSPICSTSASLSDRRGLLYINSVTAPTRGTTPRHEAAPSSPGSSSLPRNGQTLHTSERGGPPERAHPEGWLLARRT
jgi:hypothetical protein